MLAALGSRAGGVRRPGCSQAAVAPSPVSRPSRLKHVIQSLRSCADGGGAVTRVAAEVAQAGVTREHEHGQ